MIAPLRLGLFALAAAALGGCSVETFSYTVDRYGTTQATNVRLGCNDSYEVYDRPDAGTLIVITNGVNEINAVSGSPNSSWLIRAE